MANIIREGKWFDVIYDSDGHLLLIDKLKSKPVKKSRESWPDFESAKRAEALGRFTWIKGLVNL
jgi:hypothetical protein